MFSNYYQIGESIELFNSQDKSLLSKWGILGKCSKVYDPKLHTYEMVLSVGNLSKIQIPKNSKIKILSLFQSFIVFQIYLFTSKQLTIEIAISDSTNAKRRLIFSTNNLDLAINQLHCRIPLFKLPIGRWINLSIDILSFVSKCYKNLTFRSVDYISLSMSGKVRYIFAMRTPLIENNNKFEIDEEGNIIENNDLNSDNINYDSETNNITDNFDVKNNSESDFYSSAKEIPLKYKFPNFENAININIDCNKVFSQIYIENENKQLLLSKNELINTNPYIFMGIKINTNKIDKSLKNQNDNFMKSQKFQKNKNINDNIINNNIINTKKYSIKNDLINYNINQKPGNTFNKLGNLIISQSTNALNKKNTYNFDRNNIKINMNDNNLYNINITNLENKYKIKSNENKGIEKYDLFNKEEYNNLYKKGKGVTTQIRKHINNNNNSKNIKEFNIKELEEKINNELSTIHNVNNENYNFQKTLDIEQETLENNKNEENMKRQYN